MMRMKKSISSFVSHILLRLVKGERNGEKISRCSYQLFMLVLAHMNLTKIYLLQKCCPQSDEMDIGKPFTPETGFKSKIFVCPQHRFTQSIACQLILA